MTWLSILLAAWLVFVEVESAFTCQGNSGGSYNAAVNSCPDQGKQRMSMGGNVTVIVKRANNLPNKDHTGPSSLVSDPYVKFITGNSVAQSSVVRNNLNPDWGNEPVSLGVLGSGTLVKVEIWDHDIGIEGSDDLLVSGSFRVPFCSTFHANYSEVLCDTPFGCYSSDSSWAMPRRKLCVESGTVSFVNNRLCTSIYGICLEIDVHIVPFEMVVDLWYPSSQLSAPVLSAASESSSQAPWTSTFGLPFISDGTEIDMRSDTNLKGALMLRTRSREKSKGKYNSVKFYASVNFPANIYVCRNTEDNKVGIPSWMYTEFNSRNLTVTQLLIRDSTKKFACFYYESSGTVKNRYGGVKSGVIPFRSNTLQGHERYDEDSSYYRDMYIVLAIPRVIASREEIITIIYDMNMFISFFAQYGFIWCWFMYLVARFLKRKINFRLERAGAYLSTCSLSGENKTILGGLFVLPGQSPRNIVYRAHLFHARNALLFLLSLPIWLLIGWGFSVSYTVRPAALGIAISLLGSGGVLLWFGFRLWETNSWRISAMSLLVQALAVLLFLLFIISVIFVDPAVTDYHHNLNFPALSFVFGTMNLFPLMLLVFQKDQTHTINMKIFVEKLTGAVHHLKQANDAKDGKKKKAPAIGVNKLLHALLGASYTINPNVPLFRFSPVVSELKVEEELAEDEEIEADVHTLIQGHELYISSIVILIIYLIIGAQRTSYPSLAFLNCLALMLLDFLHYNLNNGDVNWSPGKKISLLVVGRLLIMGSGSTLWLANYSLAYLVYALVLINEVINHTLPMLSVRQAGKVVFAGVDEVVKQSHPDMATSAEFALGLLTFAFISIILVSAFGGTKKKLPVPDIDVWGQQWPVYVVGMISICVTITGGFIMATIRAFYLEKHGLLRGWAKANFMFDKSFRVPYVLAIGAELSIISTGLLVYGAVKAAAVLILCVYLPAILLCFGFCIQSWLKNDFELIVWPPREAVAAAQQDGPSDLDVAFNMIENLFGNDVQVVPEEETPESEPQQRTLKGFKLPTLEVTGTQVDNNIKMPPLPLKSVLRRKRQNLGIKVKTPLVKDLRTREGVEDADKFGGGDDVVDANDPWAQFEEKQVRVKKKATKLVKMKAARVGWLEHPYIVAFKQWFLSTKTGQYLVRKSNELYESLKQKGKKYATIHVFSKPAEEDEELDLEEGSGKGTLDDSSIPMAERFTKMPFWSAAAAGYLTREEYGLLGAWFGGMFLIMIMGITLAKSCSPEWIGYVVWIAVWTFICTFIPVIKYFNTFSVDQTMKRLAYFVVLLHIIFCASFWGAALDADIGTPASLWMLDYFFYFPAFLYLFYEAVRWYDGGFQLEVLDKDGDNDISIGEYIEFFKAYPILLGMMIILTWQMYLWVSYLVGYVCTILLLVVGVGYLFVRDWAANDLYLSPELALLGDYVIKFVAFVSFMVAVFRAENPIFPLSVFFFAAIFRCAVVVFARVAQTESDTMLYFSPYVLPVYSYDPRSGDLVNETDVAKYALAGLIMGALWGASMATFLYPVNIGIAVACFFLLIIAAMFSIAVSYLPTELGRYASMLTPDSIIGSANAATSMFYDRKQPLTLHMKSWDGEIPIEEETAAKTLLEKQKERTSLELAAEIISETRALTHIYDDSSYVAAQTVALEEDEPELPWYMEYWVTLKTTAKQLFDMIPIGKSTGWKKHSEGLFTSTDALAESLITGRGPFGFMGLEGGWFKLFKKAQEYPRLKFLQQPWLNAYDEFGNNKNVVMLSEPLDMPFIMSLFGDYDAALSYTFFEESRCAIHFLLLLMVIADSGLQREQVLFQKFLRENRFRLASNGISPPAAIFSSSSFASINIPLVAVWLSTLTAEERERFHLLKATFSDEQKQRDTDIDEADYQFTLNAIALERERMPREIEMATKLTDEVLKVQQQRAQQFAESLSSADYKVFALKREQWTSDADCFVEEKHLDLYGRFRAACMPDVEENTEYARKLLGEIEAAQVDCRVGEYGRVYQYVDSEFLPGESSIGQGEVLDDILGWRCAPGICDSAQLFEGGTDPDDIELGIFKDDWLLSALSMLAAGNGVGDGKVDEQIANLFIGHYGADGELTYHTELGGYCVRIFKQGMWHPIVVDDIFPMVRRVKWTNDNKGMACAHSKECRELWVSLIEKAYAKYYGNYSILSRGYVHHALQDLTGCQAECITLAQASRGTGKRSLWDMMIRARKNGYIVSAGTGEAHLADKAIQDMGLAFNAAYVILDARTVDGNKLLKLRNPPGHHEEWKGDWSDKSMLWSRRLKAKLGFVDANDRTFYMSFDDFCNVFRILYVCKWYDPQRWSMVQYPGFWKKSTELEQTENDEMTRMMMLEQGVEVEDDQQQAQQKKKKNIKAQVDTAGGLPTKHNPGCVLENNPHFALTIHRTTEVRITITQADSRGRASAELLPISILIVRNAHHKIPMRLTALTKENIVARTDEPRPDRTVYLYTTLKPGLYIVLIPAYLRGMEGNFTVKLLSNYRSKFVPLWPPKWMLKGEKGTADQLLDNAAGTTKEGISQASKYFQNSMVYLFGAGAGQDLDSDEEEDKKDEEPGPGDSQAV